MFYYDRELIYPIKLDEIIPNWLNHAMHSAPLIYNPIEAAIIPHRFKKLGNSLLLLFGGLIYTLW